MQLREHYAKAERVGHLISWLLLLAVPVGALLTLGGWLPPPFGDLGAISDVFLTVIGGVFVHGILQVSGEAGTGSENTWRGSAFASWYLAVGLWPWSIRDLLGNRNAGHRLVT